MRIFNASPLILLLEELNEPEIIEMLSELDGELLVPKRVVSEVKSSRAKKNLEDLIKREKMKICENCTDETFSFLKNRFPMLDDGELTVISLAYECKRKDCFVIIDESIGRGVSEKMNLNLKGAFGILLELYKTSMINKNRLVNICRKIDKSSFHINFKEIGYEWVLK